MPSRRPEVVFLSYSRRDKGIVQKLSLIILAVGATPWRDEEGIKRGEPWRGAIANNIAICDRMLVFWCRHARRSKEIRRRYLRAIGCARRSSR